MPSVAIAGPSLYKWQGQVLGAQADIAFFGSEKSAAMAITKRCLEEIERLENIFSLYRENSEISRLNRMTKLTAASQDMRILLALSHQIGQATGGAFDPTVQALWRLNRNWIARGFSKNGPPAEVILQALERVDYQQIVVKDGQVSLGEGQSITLNGIAQGYVTDMITALLKQAGWKNVLVNLGEYRAIGGKSAAAAFQVELQNTGIVAELNNAALASSVSKRLVFSPAPEHKIAHLFDPETGKNAHKWRSVHVRHPLASVADGLSTAFSSMPAQSITKCISAYPGTTVWTKSHKNVIDRFES